MNNDIEKQIREFIEAGERATQGEWCVVRAQELHVPSDRLSFHYSIREEDGLTDIIPDENGDQDFPNIGNDMVFVACAANARPAIKALAEERDRFREKFKKLSGKIKQKKGFYSVSVGNSEVKQAHKAGILKGLDAALKEVEQALNTEKEG